MRALDEAQQVNMAESADAAEVAFLMPNATKPPFDNQTARSAIANASLIELGNEIHGKGIPSIANGPFAPGVARLRRGHRHAPRRPASGPSELVAQYEAETGQPFEVPDHARPPSPTPWPPPSSRPRCSRRRAWT